MDAKDPEKKRTGRKAAGKDPALLQDQSRLLDLGVLQVALALVVCGLRTLCWGQETGEGMLRHKKRAKKKNGHCVCHAAWLCNPMQRAPVLSTTSQSSHLSASWLDVACIGAAPPAAAAAAALCATAALSAALTLAVAAAAAAPAAVLGSTSIGASQDLASAAGRCVQQGRLSSAERSSRAARRVFCRMSRTAHT